MKRLQFTVLNDNGSPVRTYHIDYDETEGNKYVLTINGYSYNVDERGRIIPEVPQPNPDFIPYD